MAFVSGASVEKVSSEHGLSKRVVAVKGCRTLTKKDMALNDYLPNIPVDPETCRVMVDGVHLTCEPALPLPLAQLYSLF